MRSEAPSSEKQVPKVVGYLFQIPLYIIVLYVDLISRRGQDRNNNKAIFRNPISSQATRACQHFARRKGTATFSVLVPIKWWLHEYLSLLTLHRRDGKKRGRNAHDRDRKVLEPSHTKPSGQGDKILPGIPGF